MLRLTGVGDRSPGRRVSGVAVYHGRRHVIIGPYFALTRATRVSRQITAVRASETGRI
jgi:hypothetical protein